MVWQANQLYDSMAELRPSLVVDMLQSWAEGDPNPLTILHELRVTSIMHNKIPTSPQHEYLVVQTEDSLNKTRYFILERTVNPALTDPPLDRPTAMESVQQLSAVTTTSSDADLPQFDRLTLSTVQSVKIIADCVDNKASAPALDRFLGSSYVFSKAWHGENVRLLRPDKRLSLLQLAIIAKAVHTRFPTYDVLKDQCYFHAGVIYGAVLQHFGSRPNHDPHEAKDITIAANLKYGRYHGVKVNRIDPKDVLLIVGDYMEEYSKVSV